MDENEKNSITKKEKKLKLLFYQNCVCECIKVIKI